LSETRCNGEYLFRSAAMDSFGTQLFYERSMTAT
jgi:hypothetical protein